MFHLLVFTALLLWSSAGAAPNGPNPQLNDSITTYTVEETFIQLLSRLQLSQDSDDDWCAFSSAARNGSDAELRMLDASGKPGSNLFALKAAGLWEWLGDYDECQDIGQENAHYCVFQGAYGAVLPQYTLPILKKLVFIPLLRWGLCVPRQCTAKALSVKVVATIKKIIYFNSSLVETTCEPSDVQFSTFAIIVIVLCCIIGFLVLLATVFEYSRDCVKNLHVLCQSRPLEESHCQKSSNLHEDSTLLSSDNIQRQKQSSGLCLELLLSFSLVQNVPKLLDTARSAKNIACLHGIRTLSMMWVILGHCYFFFAIFLNVANIEVVKNFPHQLAFQSIANAFFSVDSFFFLSGLLVMYLSLLQLEMSTSYLFWIKFYVHRFWRLTPTYAMALLIYWQLMPYFVDGPLWMGMYDNKQCDHYWWTNLLYINNFYPKYSDMCMGWSWFLAADTQMYILSPIAIVPAFFLGLSGLIPLACLLIAVLVTIAAIVSVKEFPANILSFTRSISGGSSVDYQNMVYVKFYTRAAPYLVGMAVGYYLARRDPLRQRLFRVWTVGGWLLAAGLGVTIVYGLYDYNNGHHYSQGASSLYLTFSSCLWGVCLAWVVYACTSGSGGIINNILSWSGWFPLSRLTYSAYLLHPVVLLVYIGSMRQTVYIDNFHMAFMFVAITGISYASAAILSLCVEYPMAAIEKAVLKRI